MTESRIKNLKTATVVVLGKPTQIQQLPCSKCNAILEFANTAGRLPPTTIRKRATSKGWKIHSGGRHLCGPCQSKRDMMQDEKVRELTRDQRRLIFRELDDSYSEKDGRYCLDVTDQSIADKLSVPRAWVLQIREENFGISGENDELVKVTALLVRIDKELQTAIDDCLRSAAKAEDLQGKVTGALLTVKGIKAAVGPHR